MSKKIVLDLSKWKHVKSDSGVTTLQHKDAGHTLTLTHNALSPENKAQLNALSKISSEAATPLQADASMHQQKMADGGEVDEYGYPKNTSGDKPLYDTSGYTKKAEGGEVEAEQPLSKEQHLNEMHKSVKSMAELKAKHGEAALKLREYFAHSMKAEKHARMAEEPEHLAQGGKVADAHSMGDKAKHQDQKAPKESAQTPHEANRQSERVLEAPVQMDEASEQSPIDSDHEHEGKAYCMHCGGKMMAEGGDPGDDQTPTPTALPAPAFNPADDQAPALDTSVPTPLGPDAAPPGVIQTDITKMPNPNPQQAREQGIRNVYDKLLNTRYGANGSSMPYQPFATSGAEGPKQLDENLWTTAKNMHQNEFDANSKAQAREMVAFDRQNQIRAEAGLKPIEAPPTLPDAMPSSGMPNQDAVSHALPTNPSGMQEEQTQRSGDGGKAPKYDPMDVVGNASAGLEEAMRANTAIGNAQSQQAKEQMAIENKVVGEKQQALQHYQNSYAELEKERKDFISDIQNGYVNPEKYWDSHSKVMSGIGMILAGFNPTSNPNAAINMLKFQMQQNLQAQERNLGAKENLLSHNLRQFGNLRDAQDMTRVMQNEYVQHQLNASAAKAGSPIAVANAQRANAMLKLENAPIMMRLSASTALRRMAQDPNASPEVAGQLIGQLAAVAPDMAKPFQEAYVPGVGVSSSLTPISPETKNMIEAHNNGLRLLHEALHFQELHPAHTPAEKLAQIQAGATLMSNLQSTVRKGQGMGVLKQFDMPILTKQLGGNPANPITDWATKNHLEEQLRESQNEYNQLLKLNNLPIRNPGTTVGSAPQQGEHGGAQPESSQARGSKTNRPQVFRNGNWYYAK